MSQCRLVWSFVLRFAFIYGLFIIPWPGWSAAYSGAFDAVGNVVFAHDSGARFVHFETFRQTRGLASIDTRIVLGNRDQADSTGKGPAQMLGFDTRSICLMPTALTVALILATPIPWPRRLLALAGGLVLIHLFILFTVWVYLWNESTKVDLVSLSLFWKQIADGLEYTFVTQMGISFTAPVLIWIAVTFRWTERPKIDQLTR